MEWQKSMGGWMGEGGCTSSTLCESHFYFLILMDRQTYLVRQGFFTDYDVCRWHCDMDERREEAEENLQWWRCVLKSTGIKGSPSRTEHTFMSQLKKSGTMSLKEVKVKKVQGYKYLGSTVLSHRDYKKQVNWRSTAVRKSVMSNGWQKVAARVKGEHLQDAERLHSDGLHICKRNAAEALGRCVEHWAARLGVKKEEVYGWDLWK